MRLLVLSLVLMPHQLFAEAEKEGTKVRVRGQISGEYNDNFFRLDGDQITRAEANDTRDVISKRFKDIDSVSDFILSPTLIVDLNIKSPLKGRLKSSLTGKYNIHLENDKASYPEIAFEITQPVVKKGRVRLESEFIYGFFRNNYLSGAEDLNSNDNISRDERIYSEATYNEIEALCAYRQRIRKRQDSNSPWLSIPGVSVEPLIGVRLRDYNDTFENRDRDIIFGGAIIDLKLNKKLGLEIQYRFEDIKCPNGTETVLFDETINGVDVNGDAAVVENAALATGVNFSRDQHIIELESAFELNKQWQGYLGYRLRSLAYSSTNPLDVDHYQTKETRHRIRAGIQWRFLKGWRARLEYQRTDDDEYEQNKIVVFVRRSCRLLN